MKAPRYLVSALIVSAVWLIAGSSLMALPFGKSWAKGADLPRPVGLGIDIFGMDHPYQIDSLTFDSPLLALIAVDGIEVENSVKHVDVKLDAWLLPFLNVFAIIGSLDAVTVVDVRGLDAVLPFESIRVSYDGLVYGGGITLAAGGQRIFGSLTATFTETDLSGDFDSSVESLVVTPKIGIHGSGGSAWIGAMYLEADEHHTGDLSVPVLGAIAFDVTLSERDQWNGLVGVSSTIKDHWQLTLEGGFGDRHTALLSLSYRF